MSMVATWTEKAMERALAKVRHALRKKKLQGTVRASVFRESVLLEGTVASWDEKVKAGYAAAGKGFRGVINDITVQDLISPKPSMPDLRDKLLESREFDVVIIGGGVIGCAIFRELTRYEISVAVLEKESDLAEHTSGRNDGMIHPGFAPKPGTKRAFYNTRGNRMYDQLTEELGVPFLRPGSMLLLGSPLAAAAVPLMKRRARKNGVDGDYRYLSRREVRKLEPFLTSRHWGAFFMPSAGQLSPYGLTVALAENGVENGGEVFLDTVVMGMEMEGPGVETEVPPFGAEDPDEAGKLEPALSPVIRSLKTNRGTLRAGVIVNAAGLWADRVAGFADDRFFSLHYRKGIDCILDTAVGKYQTRIAGMPNLRKQRKATSKGGGIVPCVEGNILIGPTAREVQRPERYDTNREDMEDLFTRFDVNPRFDPSQVISYFAGVRACTYEEDFIVEQSRRVGNLLHAAGIQSPGLASAPGIAEDISAMAAGLLGGPPLKKNFNPRRIVPPRPGDLGDAERSRLIREDPAYGRIICRCEGISEGEVRDALRRPVPARTLDGIKRRTRVCAGRCHGGFCTPRVLEIMAGELNTGMEHITKKGEGSRILLRETKSDPGRETAHDG